MTCIKCQHGTAKRFGHGRKGIQRYRCHSCKATFLEPRQKPLGTHYTDLAAAVQVLSLLTEGMSIRAASRITGLHKNTIMGLLVTAGHGCQSVTDRYVRNIRPQYVQADELWCFVHTKQKHLHFKDPSEWGDTYTWVAIDAETKLVISHLVGKRDPVSAFEFISDLNRRVTEQHRFQLTTDGLTAYPPAIEERFGAGIDYAQLIKIYGTPDANQGPDWYRPGKVIEVVPTKVSGDADEAHICTSHAERHNLSIRMATRRFTRLTNGFSKKLENLKAAVALYMAWYNFCRIHQTLRVTPAMEAGITDHVWAVPELLA
jgi:transposase-like protein/IS1 family transposase